MRNLALVTAAIVFGSAAAQAADLPPPPAPAPAAWSMSVFGGASWYNSLEDGPVEIDYDTGFLVGGALGYTPLDWLRTEVELAYSSADGTGSVFDMDVTSGSTDTLTILGNAWLGFNMLPVVGDPVNDLGAGMGFSPYFGGGLGVGFLNPGDNSDTSFAWQVGAGVRWTLASNIGLDVGYRYRSLVDAGGSSSDLSSNNLVVGLVFNF